MRVYGDLLAERATFDVTLASDSGTDERVRVVAQVRDRRLSSHRDVEMPGIVGEASASRLGQAGRWRGLVDGTRVGALTVVARDTDVYSWQVSIEMPGDERPDSVIGGVGFRTCEWRDGVFYLNGEPRYLKGALLQPTYPRTLVIPPDRTALTCGLRTSTRPVAGRAESDPIPPSAAGAWDAGSV